MKASDVVNVGPEPVHVLLARVALVMLMEVRVYAVRVRVAKLMHE